MPYCEVASDLNAISGKIKKKRCKLCVFDIFWRIFIIYIYENIYIIFRISKYESSIGYVNY